MPEDELELLELDDDEDEEEEDDEAEELLELDELDEEPDELDEELELELEELLEVPPQAVKINGISTIRNRASRFSILVFITLFLQISSEANFPIRNGRIQ